MQAIKLPWRIILIILAILFLIIVAVGFYYYKYLSVPLLIPFTNKGYQLHQTITQTFKRSDKYSSLIQQTDQAILEKDPNNQYQLLTNLFKQLKAAYKDSKDIRIVAAMYQLKNYAKSDKNYMETDFIIKQ